MATHTTTPQAVEELTQPTQRADPVDPKSQLRPQMRVVGGQGKSLGKVDAVERDPQTGHLIAVIVRHGLFRPSNTRVLADRVKWVNEDSVVLQYGRGDFGRLPTVGDGR
jgi:hypothetical protein